MAKQNSAALIQEDFFVNKEKNNGRLTVIRPKRITFDNDECLLVMGEKQFQVLNLSAFGVAIASEELAEFDEHSYATICLNNVEMAQVSLRLIRHQQDDVHKNITVFEVMGEPINVDVVTAIRKAFNVITEQEGMALASEKVAPEFKLIVYEAKQWLESLENKVNDLDIEEHFNYSEFKYNEYTDAIVAVISEYLTGKFDPIYQELQKLVSGMSKEEMKASFGFFRKMLGNLIYQAPYADRTYHKPRGYAGDYEMMNQTYSNMAIGNTLFAQCLHKYFVEEPAARAVRNRGTYLVKKLHNFITENGDKKKLKILSVACGPANEVCELITKYSDLPNVEIHFIDQDLDALKHTQSKIRNLKVKHNLGHDFKFSNLAIKNIIENGLDEGEYDLIYTAGLFDYFSQSVAQIAALRLFEGLTTGGKLVVGNFSINNPNKFGMELTLDWKLIYRTLEEMEAIFKLTGKPANIEEEDLGINLFGIVQK